ncbi:MAG: HEAT repeat domain-containing protein [Planctomycetes bacterium]|nr:HEAT repeat domain-containing protein [Planctomycetota bacterium]
MLEGLSSVDWSSVKHAYGPATDVPDQIRALASQDAKTRENARWNLYGNIFHQGTRYEATPHAVPFLFELLKEPTVQDKHEVVYLLVALAIGYDESYLPDGFDPQEFREQLTSQEVNLTDESQAECCEFGVSPGALIDCYDAILSRAVVLMDLLGADDEELRCAAAYALAWFPEVSSESLPRLRELAEQATSAVEQATAVIAFGLIARNVPNRADLAFLAPFLNEARPPLVRTAAAIALAGDARTPEIMQVLVSALQLPESALKQSTQIRFNEGKLRGYVCLVLGKHGRAQRDKVVHALCEVLRSVNSYESLDVTVAILGLIADHEGQSLQEIGLDNLDTTQKLALNAIADYGGWSSCGGFANYDLLIWLIRKNLQHNNGRRCRELAKGYWTYV